MEILEKIERLNNLLELLKKVSVEAKLLKDEFESANEIHNAVEKLLSDQ